MDHNKQQQQQQLPLTSSVRSINPNLLRIRERKTSFIAAKLGSMLQEKMMEQKKKEEVMLLTGKTRRIPMNWINVWSGPSTYVVTVMCGPITMQQSSAPIPVQLWMAIDVNQSNNNQSNTNTNNNNNNNNKGAASPSYCCGELNANEAVTFTIVTAKHCGDYESIRIGITSKQLTRTYIESISILDARTMMESWISTKSWFQSTRVEQGDAVPVPTLSFFVVSRNQQHPDGKHISVLMLQVDDPIYAQDRLDTFLQGTSDNKLQCLHVSACNDGEHRFKIVVSADGDKPNRWLVAKETSFKKQVWACIDNAALRAHQQRQYKLIFTSAWDLAARLHGRFLRIKFSKDIFVFNALKHGPVMAAAISRAKHQKQYREWKKMARFLLDKINKSNDERALIAAHLEARKEMFSPVVFKVVRKLAQSRTRMMHQSVDSISAIFARLAIAESRKREIQEQLRKTVSYAAQAVKRRSARENYSAIIAINRLKQLSLQRSRVKAAIRAQSTTTAVATVVESMIQSICFRAQVGFMAKELHYLRHVHPFAYLWAASRRIVDSRKYCVLLEAATNIIAFIQRFPNHERHKVVRSAANFLKSKARCGIIRRRRLRDRGHMVCIQSMLRRAIHRPRYLVRISAVRNLRVHFFRRVVQVRYHAMKVGIMVVSGLIRRHKAMVGVMSWLRRITELNQLVLKNPVRVHHAFSTLSCAIQRKKAMGMLSETKTAVLCLTARWKRRQVRNLWPEKRGILRWLSEPKVEKAGSIIIGMVARYWALRAFESKCARILQGKIRRFLALRRWPVLKAERRSMIKTDAKALRCLQAIIRRKVILGLARTKALRRKIKEILSKKARLAMSPLRERDYLKRVCCARLGGGAPELCDLLGSEMITHVHTTQPSDLIYEAPNNKNDEFSSKPPSPLQLPPSPVVGAYPAWKISQNRRKSQGGADSAISTPSSLAGSNAAFIAAANLMPPLRRNSGVENAVAANNMPHIKRAEKAFGFSLSVALPDPVPMGAVEKMPSSPPSMPLSEIVSACLRGVLGNPQKKIGHRSLTVLQKRSTEGSNHNHNNDHDHNHNNHHNNNAPLADIISTHHHNTKESWSNFTATTTTTSSSSNNSLKKSAFLASTPHPKMDMEKYEDLMFMTPPPSSVASSTRHKMVLGHQLPLTPFS